MKIILFEFSDRKITFVNGVFDVRSLPKVPVDHMSFAGLLRVDRKKWSSSWSIPI
jgi:hypothetical protein